MATEIEQNIQRDERTTFPYKIVFVHEFLLNMPSVGIPIHIKRLTYGKRMTCGSWVGGGSASDTIKKGAEGRKEIGAFGGCIYVFSLFAYSVSVCVSYKIYYKYCCCYYLIGSRTL